MQSFRKLQVSKVAEATAACTLTISIGTKLKIDLTHSRSVVDMYDEIGVLVHTQTRLVRRHGEGTPHVVTPVAGVTRRVVVFAVVLLYVKMTFLGLLVHTK